MTDLVAALRDFNKDRKFSRKGPLCVALVITQHARKGLPLNPDELLTEAGGQVLGLGRGAVQAVLNRHGITRVLAAEGGRTSRGSISNMREYVAFLNSRAAAGAVDLDAVEAFWIERVHEFFSAKPFKIRLDASRSLRTLVRDVIAQAEERQRNTPGMQYAGAVLQHLVRGYVDEVVIGCRGEIIARHVRSYEREDVIFDPIHYLPLIEQKINALDQAAPLQGWDLPEVFTTLRRLMETRMGKHGRREYVQVLRLLESFALADLHGAVKQALDMGAIGFDAVKHLLLCRVERRPPRLDMAIYPYLPRARVETTSARSYMRLLTGGAAA